MISNLTIDMLCMNRVRLRIWVRSTMYILHISHRHSIEKGMTHFKRSISHIAKIPSLKKKEMSLKDILRSQLLCESPSWRIRRPSVLCEQNSFYLVPSKLQLHIERWKTDDHKRLVHVLLSRFYPDFILILSWFYPDFIQILSR